MKIISIILILASALNAWAQDPGQKEFIGSITGDELKEHVRILSSDEFEGRETGFAGQKKAAEYILEQFRKLKLAGFTEDQQPGYQTFELTRNRWDQFMIIKGPDTLRINKDITVSGYWPEGDITYDIIFAGYGADTDNYSDYEGLDVKGKLVAFLSGEPMDKSGRYLTTGSFVPEYSITGIDKAVIAADKGAAGAIMIETLADRLEERIRLSEKFSDGQQFTLNAGVGLIIADQDNALKILEMEDSDLDKYTKKANKGKQDNRLFESKAEIVSEIGSNKVTGENVIGMISGSELPDEFIIVTAHYDHLGKGDDKIFHGADDNASGTAAVIEIAEAFRKACDAGETPKRSVIFMPVAGEEIGLLGSRYYVSDPMVPLENTRAVLNMDMIGRQDGLQEKDTSYVYLYLSDSIGSNLDNIAHKASSTAGAGMEILYRYKGTDEFNIGGSDHASFENEGIPVVYLYCGTHKDYHRPGDTWDKIDYSNMARITRTAFEIVWQLANK